MNLFDIITPYLPTLAVVLLGAAAILWFEVKRRDIWEDW